jgi:predicted Rossmann fold nucleotide-binding protein DprA/Smf involved in DNA uptake
MILAFTGHRPSKLGGYGSDVDLKLTRLATKVLDDLKPEQVISGMALGWDQAVAFAAIRAKIPV